jgi:hypothetical protein
MKIKKYIFLVLFFLFFAQTSLAQSNLRANYLNQRDQYFQVYDQFLSLRRTYWQQETIESKEKFRKISRDYFLSRDDLLLSYFDFVLSKSSFVDEQYRQELSNWQGWVIEHRKKVGKAYSLEDLINLSQEFDEIYPEIERSIYTFLFNRSVEEQDQIRDKTKQLSQRLAVQTTNDDWQIEVNQELNQLPNYWEESENILDRVRIIKPGVMQRRWEDIAESLSSAKQSLITALNYLDEVISNNE